MQRNEGKRDGNCTLCEAMGWICDVDVEGHDRRVGHEERPQGVMKRCNRKPFLTEIPWNHVVVRILKLGGALCLTHCRGPLYRPLCRHKKQSLRNIQCPWGTANCNINAILYCKSHFSGCFLDSCCIVNRKIRNSMAYHCVLQVAIIKVVAGTACTDRGRVDLPRVKTVVKVLRLHLSRVWPIRVVFHEKVRTRGVSMALLIDR